MGNILARSINFFESREGLFFVLILALIVQTFHSGEVFFRIATSHWATPLLVVHAGLFAIVFELAVLLFVVRGRKKLAWMFAAFSIVMNLFYYSPVWTGDTMYINIASVVSSVVLPLAIAFYSHEVMEDKLEKEVEFHKKSVDAVVKVETEIEKVEIATVKVADEVANPIEKSVDEVGPHNFGANGIATVVETESHNWGIEKVAAHFTQLPLRGESLQQLQPVYTNGSTPHVATPVKSVTDNATIAKVRATIAETIEADMKLNKSEIARSCGVTRDVVYKVCTEMGVK